MAAILADTSDEAESPREEVWISAGARSILVHQPNLLVFQPLAKWPGGEAGWQDRIDVIRRAAPAPRRFLSKPPADPSIRQ